MEQKIKTISTYLISDQTSEEGYLYIREERNEQGNQVLFEQFYPDESREVKIIKLYDGEHRLVEEQHFSESEKADQIIRFVYNQEGKLEQKSIHYQDGSVSFVKSKRDVTDNSIEIETRDDQNFVESREYHRLDAEGRVLEEVIYGEDGVFESRIKASYHENGRPVEQHFEYADGRKFSHFYDYEYNEAGLLTFAESYDIKEESIRVDELFYDENGNRIEHRIQDHQQGYALVDKMEYDENQELIKQSRHLASGRMLQEKEFTRDENNLLVREEISNDDGVVVHVFKYEFH